MNCVSEQGQSGLLWTVFEGAPFSSRRIASFADAQDARWFLASFECYALVEAYMCARNTDPKLKDHFDSLVSWMVRNKRPDGSEPRPVAPGQEL